MVHDDMQYDPVEVKVASPSKLEIRPFSIPIFATIYNASWQLTVIIKLEHNI